MQMQEIKISSAYTSSILGRNFFLIGFNTLACIAIV